MKKNIFENFFSGPSSLKFDRTFENFEIRIIRLEIFQCQFFGTCFFKKYIRSADEGGGTFFHDDFQWGGWCFFKHFFEKSNRNLLWGKSFFLRIDTTFLEMTNFFHFLWANVVMIYYGKNSCFLRMDVSIQKKEIFPWFFLEKVDPISHGETLIFSDPSIHCEEEHFWEKISTM